jgi:hypothetical protein
MENTTNVQGILIGKTLRVFVDGEMHSKTFEKQNDANKAYKTILDAQKNPTEENIIKTMEIFKGKKFSIAKKYGLEYNLNSGEVYLEGFNTPMPELLIKTFEEYHQNDFPIEAIENFWCLLMTNPDEQIRKSLFDYINTYNLVITKYGYFLAYKAVTYKETKQLNNDLSKFVQNKYLQVKRDWKTNPARYTVYKSLDNVYMITKTTTFEKWDLKGKGVIELGNLNELYENKTEIAVENKITYTDKHTRTMDIQLGKVCKMPRIDCDNNSKNSCSNGLHVGAVKYVDSFSNDNDQILMCLINPAHVVAIPNSDTSKIRVSEYFPFALAERKNDGNIDAVDSPYFENDYIEYEKQELKDMIKAVKSDEDHIKTSNNLETRNEDEIMNIISKRVVVINK